MKLSQCANLYAHHSLEFAIRDVAAKGYTGIEMWGGRPHLFRDDHSHEITYYRCLLQELGLTVCNFLPPVYKYPVNLTSRNDIIRRDSVAFMKQCADNAAAIGSPSMCLSLLWADLDQSLEESYGYLIRSYAELGEYAKDKGLKLLMESSPKEDSNLLILVDDCLRLIDELKSDVFGLVLDVGHLAVNHEDFEKTLQKCKGLPIHVHIDDNDLESDSHLIPGEGEIDIAGFIKVCQQAGYDGFYSAEVMGAHSLDPSNAAQKCYDAMKVYFEKE